MGFHETFQLVSKILERIGSKVDEERYDGLIVKRLESSNTLDKGRTTKQSHIAITGAQMDMFPYVRADGYFEANYEDEDVALKKYFVAQIPVYLHKENVEYLDSEAHLFDEIQKLVYISIVRSRRKDAADQIQMSMIYMDTPEYVEYRKIVHAGSYMILLKRKSELIYDMYSVKNVDIETDGFSLATTNNCFEKLKTNTMVHLDKFFNTEEDKEEKNKKLFRYWMKLQDKSEEDSDKVNFYSEYIISQYVNDIEKVRLPMLPEKSVFYSTNIEDIEETIHQLQNKENKSSTQIDAVKKYLEYLKEKKSENKYNDILKHNLWGIHIKNKNNALSEDNPHVCIGWSKMGDLSGLETTEDIVKRYEQCFDKNNRAKGQDVGMIRRFLKEVKVGDYIIFAQPSEFHIGKIESDYYYDDTESPEQDSDYKNNRKVTWIKKHIDRKILSTAMHNSLATAMSIFKINDYRAAVVDLLKDTYVRDEESIDNNIESISLIFKTNVDIPYERNRIVFGAPGTGKSFCLKQDSENLIKNFDGKFERVTFHSDYTYSQFVGTYKPVMDDDGEKIKYEYVPGPFMRVLTDALKGAMNKEDKPYLLLIEEINRAKVAAVFGEIFQLLDRDDDGVSEYEIQASEDMKKYFRSKIGGNLSDYEIIRIPNNMYIWATMNSADQGVFPMDTAFKRRWSFEYIGINDGQEKMFDGKIVLGKKLHSLEVSWNRLRKTINDLLASDYKVNEDKLMGPFFLAKRVTECDENGNIKNPEEFIKVFKSKVIMYLYEDAAKQHKHKLFSGCDSTKYSSVCEAFDNIGIKIFGDLFVEKYNNQKG